MPTIDRDGYAAVVTYILDRDAESVAQGDTTAWNNLRDSLLRIAGCADQLQGRADRAEQQAQESRDDLRAIAALAKGARRALREVRLDKLAAPGDGSAEALSRTLAAQQASADLAEVREALAAIERTA